MAIFPNKKFFTVSLNNQFSHTAGYFTAWGISRICVWVFVCVCVCCTFICIHCEWLSTISACELQKQRWFWENRFIFIHSSCKNNRSNNRESVCWSFPLSINRNYGIFLYWYMCFLYQQLKSMFLITDTFFWLFKNNFNSIILFTIESKSRQYTS